MEFRLCANNDVTKPITQQYVDENVLEIVGYNGVRYDVSPRDSQILLQVKTTGGSHLYAVCATMEVPRR